MTYWNYLSEIFSGVKISSGSFFFNNILKITPGNVLLEAFFFIFTLRQRTIKQVLLRISTLIHLFSLDSLSRKSLSNTYFLLTLNDHNISWTKKERRDSNNFHSELWLGTKTCVVQQDSIIILFGSRNGEGMLQRLKSDELRTKRKRQEINKRRMIIHGRKVEEQRGETSQKLESSSKHVELYFINQGDETSQGVVQSIFSKTQHKYRHIHTYIHKDLNGIRMKTWQQGYAVLIFPQGTSIHVFLLGLKYFLAM